MEAMEADERIEALAEEVGVIEHAFAIEAVELVNLSAEEDETEEGGSQETESADLGLGALEAGERENHQQGRHQQDEGAEGGQWNVEDLGVGHPDAARLVHHEDRNQAGEEYAL